MSDGPDLFGRIQALLIEGNLDPTPAHYEFLYRYVTGSDPQIVEAVNAVRRMTGTIDARVVGNIRRELYGVGRGGVGRVLDDAEAQLSRISSYVERSGADARDYGARLGGRVELGSATMERQRAMLAEMIDATNVMIARTGAMQDELARSTREIDLLKADLAVARVESRSDALTGLANRKACCDYLDAQLERAHADDTPLSLVFLDIDHFKRFNDSFGHRVGDEVLRLVAQSLDRSFHGLGFVARWGGEEFVVVLPGSTADEAEGHAERFRAHVATRRVRTRASGEEIGRVTLSLGVAGILADDTAQSIIDRADDALYEAKAAGRDRVVQWKAAA